MRIFFTFLIILLGILHNKAQTWCPPGATWYYRHTGQIAGIDGFVEFKYTNDLMVNNINCKHITGTFKGYQLGWSYQRANVVIPNVKSYLTYENNNVIYLYNGISFDTVVNFNAAIGDKWLELKYTSNCNNIRSHHEVIDTGHVSINNVYLKRVTVSCSYSTTFNSVVQTNSFTTSFIERLILQGTTLGMYKDLFGYHCDRDGIYEYPFVSFTCYQDDTFPLYNVSGTSCDNLTGLNDFDNLLGYNVILYPNPARDVLVIENSLNTDELDLSLIDVLGKEVKRARFNDKTILDLKDINAGIYVVQIRLEGKLVETKKIVKE